MRVFSLCKVGDEQCALEHVICHLTCRDGLGGPRWLLGALLLVAMFKALDPNLENVRLLFNPDLGPYTHHVESNAGTNPFSTQNR